MAAWLWLFAIWWIWRPMVRSSPWLAATLLTIGLIGVPFFCLGWQERLRISGWMIVSDEIVGGASSIGATLATIAVWIFAWRKKNRRHPRKERIRFVGNIAASVMIALAAFALAIAIDAATRIEEEFLVAAALFAGAAAIALLWSRPLYRSENREIPTIDGKLDVRCPTCGYTLIGLRDLRCPECGSTFELDELIASQAFITQRLSRRESRAEAEHPQDRPNPNSR
ncbi:MAG: hypothetical protein HZB38_01985 [Planctomycetes bacterium]|nr:hypothetical protein [Planctomycetota bacterium]